ncbi:MAG: Wzz/FepE/Etk N-terminal domain-containing protein [Bacteroidia bacterium]
MKEFENNEDMFSEIWKYKFQVLGVVFLVSVITVAATFLIKPKYKSTSIVYPVNIFPTSDESSTEQLLQYFNSNDIKQSLAEKYKLYEYYGVDTTKEKYGKALFDYMYKENISISPTLYESIEITVKDENPYKAQELNGGILALTNDLVKNNKRYILYQYITNIGNTLSMQNRAMDSLNEVVKKSNIEINDDEAVISNVPKKGKKKSKLAKKVKDKEYIEKMKGLAKSYGRIVYKRDKFYMDYNGDLTFFSIVSHPTVADKRCYPVRSLFAITAAASSFILSIVVILIRYRIRLRRAKTAQ